MARTYSPCGGFSRAKGRVCILGDMSHCTPLWQVGTHLLHYSPHCLPQLCAGPHSSVPLFIHSTNMQNALYVLALGNINI